MDVLRNNGPFKERKNAMVINAILNILLSIVLAKPFGMTGILGATAIARVLTIVWWEPYILFKKSLKDLWQIILNSRQESLVVMFLL